MTYNVFNGTLNPTHFTHLAEDKKEWQKLKELEVIHLLLSGLLEEQDRLLLKVLSGSFVY